MVRTSEVDFDRIFPIRDEASAWFMSFKAECLCRAGIVSESERRNVWARAAEWVQQQQAA
jgi:hypothetical protein